MEIRSSFDPYPHSTGTKSGEEPVGLGDLKQEIVDGVSKMSEVDRVLLAPGESLDMEPGGYHLMLMGPNGGLPIGFLMELDVEAADGRVFRFEVPVEKR